VPDGTRFVETARALQALASLRPGLRAVVGLGLHRRMDAEELRPLMDCGLELVQHDPDACVDLGLVQGLPCQVHPWVAEGPSLALGGIELHQYAGFSGGHKAVSVGCGGRATLAALHRRELVCDPRVQVGRIQGNPFREAVDALGRRAGCVWAVQQLPDGRWLSGSPEDALRRGARAQEPWFELEGSFASALFRVPRTKATNLYQASRAVTYLGLSPRPPLRPGAVLMLEAACSEGMGRGSGEQAFAALVRRAPDLVSLLSGPVPSGAGLQRAYMLARLKQRGFRLQVWGCESAQELRDHGFEAFEEPAPEAELLVDQPFRRLPQRAGRPGGDGAS
jgi:hypothetical protein